MSQDAFAELGISRDATPEEARRAYLRLLKTRKPEVDAEGFRRLREAYEAVRTFLELRARGRRVPAAQAPAPVEVVSVEAPASPAVAPSPRPARVVEPDPDGERLREISQLLDDDPAHRRQALVALAAHFREAARKLLVPVLSPHVTLTLLFEAHDRGWIAEAAALQAAFTTWLDATGNEVKIMGPVAARWVMVRELGRLPAELSQAVRSAIARGGRTGEMDALNASLQELASRPSGRSARDAKILRDSGGPVASRAAQILLPRALPVRRRSWATGARLAIWIASAALMGALRLLTQATPGDDHHDPAATTAPAPPPPPDPVPLASRLRSAGQLAAKIADDANVLQQWTLAKDAGEVEAAMGAGGCDRARAATKRMRESSSPPTLVARVHELSLQVDEACAGFLGETK